MYRTLMCLVTAILFSANAVIIAQSANRDWISIFSNTSFEILADTDMVIVRVPVKIKPEINPEQVTLKLFDVSLGNRHEMRLVNAIQLLPLNDAGNISGPALRIQVDLRQIKFQGTYNLSFLATSKNSDDVYLNMTLNIPAATLRQEGPVVIDYPGTSMRENRKTISKNGLENINETTLNLQEISGKSRLTEIKIYSLGFSDANNRKIEGDVEFSEVPTLIDPYGSSPVKYRLTGKFPLGSVNGKAEVSAPQLAALQSIEFKVNRQVTPWLILIIAIAGLVIGFISRTWLNAPYASC